MISAGRACQLLVPPSFLCFLVTLFFSRTLIPVTCLRKVRITENPNHGSCLYPTNMVCIRTLLLVEASCWSCLCWSSSFWSWTSSPRAPLLTVARYDAIWLFVIMYLYVSQSLCCFFLNWCLLVSNMSISGRTFNLVVRKFMRRHHPEVRRLCLGHQRGGCGCHFRYFLLIILLLSDLFFLADTIQPPPPVQCHATTSHCHWASGVSRASAWCVLACFWRNHHPL